MYSSAHAARPGNVPVAPTPRNMSQTNNTANTEDSGGVITTVAGPKLYNNKLGALEYGWWLTQNGTVPYIKLAPIFENMRGEQPTKGAPMYDWKNCIFFPMNPLYLPAINEIFETVAALELERIRNLDADPAQYLVRGQGIVSGDINGDHTILVIGNDLRNYGYGMYILLITRRNGEKREVLFDLTGDLHDTTYQIYRNFNHDTNAFESPPTAVETPIAIAAFGTYLRQAIAYTYAPFGIGTRSQSRNTGNPIVAPRGQAELGNVPPTRQISSGGGIDLNG